MSAFSWVGLIARAAKKERGRLVTCHFCLLASHGRFRSPMIDFSYTQALRFNAVLSSFSAAVSSELRTERRWCAEGIPASGLGFGVQPRWSIIVVARRAKYNAREELKTSRIRASCDMFVQHFLFAQLRGVHPRCRPVRNAKSHRS